MHLQFFLGIKLKINSYGPENINDFKTTDMYFQNSSVPDNGILVYLCQNLVLLLFIKIPICQFDK